MRLKDVLTDFKVWVTAAIVVVAVIVYLQINGSNPNGSEPSQKQQKTVAFVLSKADANAITKVVTDMVEDCGEWGMNTSVVTIDTASKYADYALKAATNLATREETAKFGNSVVSRNDKRVSCLASYVSKKSTMVTDTPVYTPRDAMLTYKVIDKVKVSDPMQSHLTMNAHGRKSVTVSVRWKSLESGLYLKHKAEPAKNGEKQALDEYAPYTKTHEYDDVRMEVEKNESNHWRITTISGKEWEESGYTNVLAPVVALEKGAKRLLTPKEQQAASNLDHSTDSVKNAAKALSEGVHDDGTNVDIMKNRCINRESKLFECDMNGNRIKNNGQQQQQSESAQK